MFPEPFLRKKRRSGDGGGRGEPGGVLIGDIEGRWTT